jgi:hypothetical protein
MTVKCVDKFQEGTCSIDLFFRLRQGDPRGSNVSRGVLYQKGQKNNSVTNDEAGNRADDLSSCNTSELTDFHSPPS